MKKNLLVVSKMTKISWILTRSLKSLTNLCYDWVPICKLFNVWLEKIQRSYARCKIWRNTSLLFEKWHVEFGKFLPEHSKLSKLGLLWDAFVQSRNFMSLKFTRDLCFKRMKNDTIQELKRNWLAVLKSTWEIWQILTWSLKSLQNLHFKWAPCDQRI